MSTRTSLPTVPLLSLDRGQTPSLSNSQRDVPAVDPHPVKKIARKKRTNRASKRRRVKEEDYLANPVDPPAPRRSQRRRRYEPYRKADPTPEPEANPPADREEINALDATAKTMFKNDREILEYIEALNHRTAAVLEHVNRIGSQLLSCKGTRKKMELFIAQRHESNDSGTYPRDIPSNPDLPPATIPDWNSALPAVGEDLFTRDAIDVNLPYHYLPDVFGDFVSRFPNNHAEEEDLFRPETPPARVPSLPPGHEDENVIQYEGAVETQSDFPAPPDHATLASDDSTFNRTGVDLRIASDTGLLFPLPDEEFARVSKELRLEAMDTIAALTVAPPTHLPRHPLAQSYVPSSTPNLQPEPQHLVLPRSVLRTPSPSPALLRHKRKRVFTPEDDDKDTGEIAGPPVSPNDSNLLQVEARKNGGRVSAKRRKLVPQKPTRDHGTSYAPAAPALLPALELDSFPYIGITQTQKEESHVTGMLSWVVEQAESEDEREPAETAFTGFGASIYSLPALTADNDQGTSVETTQSKLETPAESWALAKVTPPVPEDVFGPIVLSVKATKIPGRLPVEISRRSVDGDVFLSDPEHEASHVSRKSLRFSLDGTTEKDHKVFRKTPIIPRTSLGTIAAGAVPPAEAEAGTRGIHNPSPLPKKKPPVAARSRKPKATPLIKPETVISPGGGLPSISASKPPSRPRRGRLALVKPEVPPLRAPVRRSARNKE